MSLNVFYPRNFPASNPREVDKLAWQILQEHLDPNIVLITGTEIPQPTGYEILISGRPTIEQLDASPNLRTLLIPWAGLPEATAQRMAAYPQVAVHNLHHNAAATAETALMLLFAAAKLIIPIERRFREHDWRPRYAPNPALLLKDKTALILGYGSIGEDVARACAAIGMRVLATRRNPDKSATQQPGVEIHPPDALHFLLPQANVLIITLPLTPETNGLIGTAELDLLPDDAIVVNVGRGPIVEQHALFHALKEGRLHSAGIDVWYNYPPDEEVRANTPPADVPFHELDNIVMSPHRGGGAKEIEIYRMQHIADFLNAAAAGRTLPNKIDLERGY